MTRILLVLILFAASVEAQIRFPSYRSLNFQHTSPGALKFGLYGYDNPALLTSLHQPDVLFTWSDAGGTWRSPNRWGLFFGIPSAGFGVVHQELDDGYVNDFRFSMAWGRPSLSAGVGFGWSSGETRLVNRSNHVTVGILSRPNRYLSIGLATTNSVGRASDAERVIDLAVRPTGDEMLTLFVDASHRTGQKLKNAEWSAGAAAEILPGFRLVGRYFDTRAFTVGLQLSLGNSGVASQAHFDRNGKHQYATYGIRFGAYDRTVLRSLTHKQSSYVELNMFGPIKYRRFMLFDQSKTLLDMLNAIDAAKHDPAVSGIAINTSGMNVNRAMLWELREKLKDFKSAGKRVVVFIDRPSIDNYHFASVADTIVMDTQGMIQLSGYVAGRTFLKGTFEKLGIGFDEWRFFEYKSALESFARDRMSDADREQRQKLLDDAYELARADISSGRGLTPARFDELVNDHAFLLPQDALAAGLVDTLGRWETVREVIKQLEGKEKCSMQPGQVERFNLPKDNRWGELPRIAVIYALGVCAMDEGIHARKLVKDVQSAVKDKSIRAIVLRVDSPGGDAMASDYIAEALKKAKGKKPVIVSQGYVAASGGYWLSMYADTIVAAPNTITGSIGVIGGWLYNISLKESLGMTTDRVQVGKHADLGFGFTLPLLGIGLPDRNLTAEERARMEVIIRSLYGDFVNKVATGREKSTEDVGAIAEGRVWSGTDGLKIGLVDVLGGLETAIRIAKERAGIAHDEEVAIVELPKPGLFDPSAFMPRFFGIDVTKADPMVEYLQFRLKNNGVPMPLLPLEEIDFRAMEY